MNQKGAIALVAPILLVLIIVAIVFILISQGFIKNPFKSFSLPTVKKEPAVSLQKRYQNPFDKSAQYVNPFSEFKNPFDLLKK